MLAPARVLAAESYVDELIAEAEQQQLASSREWANLLHVEPALFGKPRSTVKSDWFFVAADGATDPAAELRATLVAFFDPAIRPPRDEPAQCLFGARYAWLDARLKFDPARLPRQVCDSRDTWMKALAPEQLWVVFPSAYLNSPASMFGHTLLRLDGPEVKAGTPLLAYAANYVAETPETNGLLFAVKGLTGGYLGQYSVLPYYEKVKEYARLESRDVWEYPLAFNPAAREQLLLHLWELRGAAFTYYFFTRNCSYQLLTLLRVADPTIEWGHRFDWRAIPTDTLRVLLPVLGAPQYRPALATVIAAEGRALDAGQREQAVALAAGRLIADQASAPASAAVLSLANDLLQYRFGAGAVPRVTATGRSLSLLRARAATGEKGGRADVAIPERDPAQGHQTSRVALGVRARRGAAEVATLDWRPAYHDLLDPPAGYSDGQQIGFLDVGLRSRLDNGATTLDHLTVVDIVSIAPRSALFQPISWRFRAAHERADLGLGRDPRTTVLQGGPGLAWGRFASIVGYGNAELRAEIGNARSDGYALQLGPRLGLLAQPQKFWSLQLEARWLPGLAGDQADRRTISLEQQWQLGKNYGLRLGARALWLGPEETQQLDLRLIRYF
ncbi:MAG: DUF4105 domain-containing protein [Nevskia sp.]|nr:DUF4105 domain-containing protein [Nevskia sp.]